jgi:hypothetical protein
MNKTLDYICLLIGTYNRTMARGWESKSVEEQQSEFNKPQDLKKPTTKEEAARAQRVQALQLARANVRQQLARAQNERHKELLQRELQHLDDELAKS